MANPICSGRELSKNFGSLESFFGLDPSVTFLIGGLGAGKTELALNLAVSFSEELGSGKVDLIDLDIVNPFFRVRKVKEEIAGFGVNVVTPDSRVLNGDLPALPASVWSVFEKPDRHVICDVGGGELGLRPLARVSEFSRNSDSRVFFVLNPYRPGFRTKAQMMESFRYMESLSTLKVTHLVANPHLVGETTYEIFDEGLRRVKEFSGEVGKPLAFAMTTREIGEKVPDEMRSGVFMIQRFWEIPWAFGIRKEV